MTHSQDILDLRDAYQLCQSLEVVHEYGPLRAYRDHQLVQRMWRETIDPAVKRVHSTLTTVAPGIHEASAPSPWHAYFYLRAQHQYVYRSGRAMHRPAGADDPPVGEHMFFRGQRCSCWDFTSSLARRDAASRGAAERAVEALAEYFKRFALDDSIRRNTALCFAQHYGIPTSYADVSCDADIGVWFATHPHSMDCPDGGSKAVVRAFTWAAQERGAPVRVLLAPPFVRNVYLQRGLFIDTTATGGELKGSLTLDVTFPVETAGGEFDVVRNGGPLEIWPGLDDTERELVSWAEAIAEESDSRSGAADLAATKRQKDGAPRFWLDRELFDFESHVADWLLMLDWALPATCVTALPSTPGSEPPMRYEVLESKARSLVSANPDFFRSFTLALEGARFSRSGVLREVLRIAADELDLDVTL